MRSLYILCAAAAFALLASLPLHPAAADAGDQPTILAVQSYLNGIATLRANFTQSSSDGKHSSGVFLLKRPGRLRFQYDKPLTDFIVADGSQIYYYDGQMKQQSSAPISKSLADFFLRRDLTLSGDIRVSEVKHQGGQILLTLVQAQDPLSGSLTLMLSESPVELKKWRVVDAQGLTTEVELSGTQTGMKIDNDLFHYVDPARGTTYNER